MKSEFIAILVCWAISIGFFINHEHDEFNSGIDRELCVIRVIKMSVFYSGSRDDITLGTEDIEGLRECGYTNIADMHELDITETH